MLHNNPSRLGIEEDFGAIKSGGNNRRIVAHTLRCGDTGAEGGATLPALEYLRNIATSGFTAKLQKIPLFTL
jgi:hypothetical protein